MFQVSDLDSKAPYLQLYHAEFDGFLVDGMPLLNNGLTAQKFHNRWHGHREDYNERI